MENPGLKALMKKTGASPTHLWMRAKAVNPRLKVKRVYFKPTRGSAIKEKRLICAKKFVAVPVKKRLCYTHLDECKLWILQPHLGRAIGEEGENISCETPLVPGAGRTNFPPEACGKMSFIIAVHPILGLVHFQFLSSTTNDKMHGRYKARTHLHSKLI